jgi:hypothetical protein
MSTTTLEQVAYYCVIIMMAVLILKQIQHPLSRIIRFFNPISRERRFNALFDRVEELESFRYETERKIKQIQTKPKK